MSKKEPKMSWYDLTPKEKVKYLVELYEQIPFTTISKEEREREIEYYTKNMFEGSDDDESYDLLIQKLFYLIDLINLYKLIDDIDDTIISQDEKIKQINKYKESDFGDADYNKYKRLITELKKPIVKNLINLYKKIPNTIISEDEKEEQINHYRNSDFGDADYNKYKKLTTELQELIDKKKRTLIGGKKSRKSRKSRKQRKSRKSRKRKTTKKSKKSKK